MDNNNNQSSQSSGGSEEAKKPGGTLDLQNISIKTLKDDIAEESGEAGQDKAGWFGFLAKHKGSPQPSVPSPKSPDTAGQSETPSEGITTNIETPQSLDKSLEPMGQTDSLLDKELEQFKAESEKPKNIPPEPEKIPSDNIEAPSNLPISDQPLSPLAEEPSSDTLGKTISADNSPNSLNPLNPLNSSNSTEERPALGSFFPPKEVEAEEPKPDINTIQNKLSSALAGDTKTSIAGATYESPLQKNGDQMSRINPMPRGGIAGGMLEGEEEQKSKNPFSTRLKTEEPEKKSLLQSVESALNYSAPPEFSEEREKIGTGEPEEGKVVDLREKPEVKAMGILQNKRMLIILGGVGGLVIVVIIVLSLVLGGSSQNKTVVQTNANTQANKNQNVNPVAQIKPTPAPKPVVNPIKILPTTQEIQVGSIDAIAEKLDGIREGQGVKKQTQLIFLKSDGSSVSFQDLMNATGINIPQKVLPQPGAVPALIFADFFKGQTIIGMVIPTVDASDLAVSKMKNWESTMVLDLGQLWKGIIIDNQGAYFTDSQLFENARFALIDKKNKLSLDYMVSDGYIFIACGKDSMSILENNFISDTSGSGIKWEEDSETSVSGVEGSDSNNNSNSNTNSSDNGQ